MSILQVRGLKAGVGGQDILRGIDLSVSSGEVHAVMGPNGSGKSTLAHVIMGKPGYHVTGGSVTLDGVELIGMPTWQRAQAGLFLAMQYPTEVPGVSLEDALSAALEARGDDLAGLRERVAAVAGRIGLPPALLTRALNVDLSGGEKKRNETLQLGIMAPKIAVLDEIDSGLDVDALRDVSRRVEAITHEMGVGVLVITHYSRLLRELKSDKVSVLRGGRIVASGGPELADELEKTGYAGYEQDEREITAPSS
ncbi:MAG: Fe-S cluster assembly ATP-binding protein [Actinomycetota bacterium]|nr:Fe-S cluster assembly ATP-binding protein [Actinomycetota bacterium]